MKYHLTYDEFKEAINYERITELENKINSLTKHLSIETDTDKKKEIEKQIKKNKLKLMIAQID